jgi:hypothetical protein
LFHPTDTVKSSHSAGDAAKAHRAERAEGEVGARGEIPDGSGHDDLPIRGLSQGSRGDVDADPANVVVADLDLPRVDRRTDEP